MAVRRVWRCMTRRCDVLLGTVLFSLLKVKNVMIFYCPYCINIHFRQCRAAMFSYPYIRPARLSDCFVMPKKHSHEHHDGNEMRAMIW